MSVFGFLLLNNTFLGVFHILFIHLTNSMDIWIVPTFVYKFSDDFHFSCNIYLGIELLHYMVTVVDILRNCQTVSKVATPFLLPPVIDEGSSFYIMAILVPVSFLL